MKTLTLISIVLLSIQIHAAFPDGFEEKLSDAIDAGLENKKFVGLSVLVINSDGQVIKKHFGHRDLENKVKPDDLTLYELGSITKPFARLAFATQDKIKLEDPISKFLPQGIRVPQPNGREIKIVELMTHTGIKFSVPCTIRQPIPQNLICYGVDLEPSLTDPYKDTTREKLYEFVTDFSYTVEEFPQLFPTPGTYHSYSNVGIGLLGEFLGQENNTSFEQFLKTSVLQPLNMSDTSITISCEAHGTCENLTKVYSKSTLGDQWEPKSLWHLPGMSAAGGLRSNLNDMELFLKANLKPEYSPIESAIKLTHSELPDISNQHNSNICEDGETPATHNCNPAEKTYFYGWEAVPESVFYHGGATGASQAMMMFSADKSVGVVVLGNSKVGEGEASLYHYPNDVAVCVFQLLGKAITGTDFCKKLEL